MVFCLATDEPPRLLYVLMLACDLSYLPAPPLCKHQLVQAWDLV